MSWSKYNPLSLTSLCVNSQTQDQGTPVGSKGNYLEKAAMFQVEGGMLITLVDSQDAASSFSFLQSLYGLINYETMHRWFIWEEEIFKPFFFPSQIQNRSRKAFYHMSEAHLQLYIMHGKVLMYHLNTDGGLTSQGSRIIWGKICKMQRTLVFGFLAKVYLICFTFSIPYFILFSL